MAPRGETPVHRSWDRYDRLSVISALTISPKRRRTALYFSVHDDTIRAKEAGQFVRRLRRQLRGGKLLLVWDRLNTHGSAAPSLASGDAIAIEWLPPCAPDLNPVEAVWRHAKYADMANSIPDDILHLQAERAISLTPSAATAICSAERSITLGCRYETAFL